MSSEHYFLYRLLREDENPLVEGIKAKIPLAEEPSCSHIRNGSRKDSQWISTSASLKAVEMFVGLRKKKYGSSADCRVVKINRRKLERYSNDCENSFKHNSPLYQEKFCGNGFRTELVPLNKRTGKIIDLTKYENMEIHVSNQRARAYASKYCEVLVERFVPANCCICILNYSN